MYYPAIDLHKNNLQVVTVDQEGKIEDSVRLDTADKEAIKRYFASFPPGTSVVIEATTGWEWLSDMLMELGLKVKLANPHKVRLIAEATIKTDKVDALTLAQLERTNFLPTSYIPPKDVREKRSITRHRRRLVKLRTICKNAIHSSLREKGIQIREVSDLFSKKGKKLLQEIDIRGVYREEMDDYLSIIDTLDSCIERQEEKMKKISQTGENIQLLMTIPGFSYISAVTILAEIGDISRFSSAKNLCSFAGLVPTTSQSGDKVYHRHLKKDSNKTIRTTLLQIVPHIIRACPYLRAKYERIAREKGKNKARIAIAQKICRIIYGVLREKEPYRMEGARRSKGTPVKPLIVRGPKRPFC